MCLVTPLPPQHTALQCNVHTYTYYAVIAQYSQYTQYAMAHLYPRSVMSIHITLPSHSTLECSHTEAIPYYETQCYNVQITKYTVSVSSIFVAACIPFPQMLYIAAYAYSIDTDYPSRHAVCQQIYSSLCGAPALPIAAEMASSRAGLTPREGREGFTGRNLEKTLTNQFRALEVHILVSKLIITRLN